MPASAWNAASLYGAPTIPAWPSHSGTGTDADPVTAQIGFPGPASIRQYRIRRIEGCTAAGTSRSMTHEGNAVVGAHKVIGQSALAWRLPVRRLRQIEVVPQQRFEIGESRVRAWELMQCLRERRRRNEAVLRITDLASSTASADSVGKASAKSALHGVPGRRRTHPAD